MTDEVGFQTGPIFDDADTRAKGIDAIPSTLGERFVGDFASNPTQQIGRLFGRTFAETGVDPVSGYYSMPAEPKIPAGEANSRYGIGDDLEFTNDVPPSVAASMYDAKRAELAQQDILRRQPSGLGHALAGVGTDFLASSLDPLNIASTFIPVVGPARYAAWLEGAGSTLARAAVRFGVGAAQGVVGQTPLVAMRYAMAKQEQGDYSAVNALTDIGYGGILGGVLNAGGGLVGDLLHRPAIGTPSGNAEPLSAEARSMEAAPLETKETALRTAIAQAADGRPVEVMPVFSANDMRLMSREADLRQQGGALDEFINGLEVSPNAEQARGTLARLNAVETQLADESLSAAERRVLTARRDELLTNTNPETLREQASGLEIRRQATAQRENIGSMLADIEKQRAAPAADTALSPLPKLQDDPRFQQAARYAAGEPLPEHEAMSAMADNAVKAPAQIDTEIAELEGMVQHGQSTGELPAQIPELDAANAGVAKAESSRAAYAAAALCLGRGGA